MSQPKGKTPAAGKSQRHRTQADRRQEAEGKMLHAAIGLIAERGIKGTTLGDIGERAGYSRGLAAHHFKSKHELIKATLAEIRRRFAVKTGEVRELEHGRLEAIVAAYLSESESTASLAFQAIMKEALTRDSKFVSAARDYNRRSIANMVEEIEKAIESKEIRSTIDPVAFATLQLATLRGVRSLGFLAGDQVSMKKVSAAVISHLRRSAGRSTAD